MQLKILAGFEQLWAREVRTRHGLPPFGRLLGLGRHKNRTRGNRLTDDELFDLVVDAVLYCLGKFDEQHPPNEGVCRRGTEDRFVYFVGRKLDWDMNTLLRSRKKHKREYGRYRGPRADRYENAAQPRSKAAMLQLVHLAMGRLDPGDRALLVRRHWGQLSWKDIAAEFGMSSRFQAARRVEQVQIRLQGLILEELGAAVVGVEDDFDAAGAALAA